MAFIAHKSAFKTGMLPQLQKNLSLVMKEGDAGSLQRIPEDEMVHKATGMLLLEVLLALALSLGLRMIFATLHRLKAGLQDLAGDCANEGPAAHSSVVHAVQAGQAYF